MSLRYRVGNVSVVSVLVLAVGCSDFTEPPKKSPKSIFGKTTQDIGNFDPAGGGEVSDSKVRITNPVTAGLEAYGPLMEQISKSGVEQAVRLYEAENGFYPRTYEEFMEKIVKANNIRLPVLPAGAKYQYDVANHKLEVVKAESAEAAPGAQ